MLPAFGDNLEFVTLNDATGPPEELIGYIMQFVFGSPQQFKAICGNLSQIEKQGPHAFSRVGEAPAVYCVVDIFVQKPQLPSVLKNYQSQKNFSRNGVDAICHIPGKTFRHGTSHQLNNFRTEEFKTSFHVIRSSCASQCIFCLHHADFLDRYAAPKRSKSMPCLMVACQEMLSLFVVGDSVCSHGDSSCC